jgi:serine/threonine protein kinase
MMTPERYEQIDDLVAAALELEASQRKAFLDKACAGDALLRREVESLIAAHEQAEERDFLGAPAVASHTLLLAADQPTEAIPDKPMILDDRYVVERELGRGSFGVVYLACDLKLHSRLVVVKVLQPNVGQDGYQLNEYLKRKFRGEVDALTRFRHPHIVGILDQGELPDGSPFLVMEFIEGAPLRSVMKSGRVEFARAARMMQQVGEALSYAHDRFVFHRDLKPENIMLRTGEDFVILIDFGIATVKEWPHATRGAKTVISGTPGYMAPEQIKGEPSRASDIWAQGVIAYEMLTGRLPFIVPRDERGHVQLGKLYEMQQAGVVA